ncbi:Flagellar hook-associated protein 2 [Aquicella siphonis]|uniref:Flagellar hook-associated protein 2 n=1 Tax=Aquicella siphonis TaxID=254247 RepID=A0A5E4PL10_9COXI|nr:flagellar filament capping protein FliD [Aquicella siphonis]VVC77091.1 Flagellar hook-associated protein 2 [Aquicella siphonis]
MSSIGLNLYDVTDTVDKLMAKQYIKYFQLQTAKSAEQIQLTAYGSLQSLFTTFQQKMKSLGEAFDTIAYQAVSSNSAIVNAVVTGNGVGSGSHTLTVTQLAQAQRYSSQAVFSSRSTGLGFDETLTFTNGGAENFSIDIDSGDSLEAIRDKINNAQDNIGVSAAIVTSTGTGGALQYNLVLTASEGTANQVAITGDTGNHFDFTETVAAADAEFTFDGYNEVRSSNAVDGVMDGLSFTLSALGTATVTTSSNNVNVGEKVKSALIDMLAAYNQIITFLDGNQYVTSKDENSKQSTTLVNNVFGFIKSRLQTAMNTAFNGAGGVHTLRDAGIVISPSTKVTDQYDTARESTSIGSLMIDIKPQDAYDGSTTMDWLLNNDFNALKDFFTNEDSGLFANVNDMIDNHIISSESDGIIKNAMDSVQKQAAYTDKQITSEKDRLDLVKAGLIDQFSRLNGVISYYQNISDALEKQYAYLDNLIRSGK